jgi:hypothetical protein
MAPPGPWQPAATYNILAIADGARRLWILK